MGESTKIEWTDHTFNPWWGCQRVSPGCEHCYAEAFAKRVGLKVWGPEGDRRVFGNKHWAAPLKWNRAAIAANLAARQAGLAAPPRPRVFCASMADVFEDLEVLRPHRARLWQLMHDTPHLDWLLLTKRPENAARLALEAWGDGRSDTTVWQWGSVWLPNVWLGTTTEDQAYADKRLPALLATGAAVHFVSYEPALGPIDFTRYLPKSFRRSDGRWNCSACCNKDGCDEPNHAYRPQCRVCDGTGAVTAIDWIIVGGESGGGARPFDIGWARQTVRQCQAAGTAVFVKQFGKEPFATVSASSGGELAFDLKDKKGGNMDEWPEDLRVRQWPPSRSG